MVLSDNINLQGTNPLIGHNDEAFGARFFDLDRRLRSRLSASGRARGQEAGHQHSWGRLHRVTGQYETPAEIVACAGAWRRTPWVCHRARDHRLPATCDEGARDFLLTNAAAAVRTSRSTTKTFWKGAAAVAWTIRRDAESVIPARSGRCGSKL